MKNIHSIKPQLRYIIVIFFLSCFCALNAQDVRRVTVTTDLEDIADELYKDGNYYEAISYYEQAKDESRKKNKPSLNYKLADCYRRSRLYEEAEALYASIAREANESYPLALFWQAMMEKSNEDYKKAAVTFSDFESKYNGKEKRYIEKARLEVEECSAKANVKPLKYDVKSLNSVINKEYSNNGVFIFGDSLWLTGTIKDKMSLGNGKGHYDEYYLFRIFVSKKESDGTWSEREIIDVKLDNKYADIATPSISHNGEILFFTVHTLIDNKDKFQIYSLNLKGGKKAKAELLSDKINKPENSSKDPCLVKVGRDQVFFFTSDRKGSGGFDIFYSKMDDFGTFTEPKNLGNKINTRTNEHSPFYDPVTETLYYSTKGKSGFGGYDIFKTKGNPQDGWEDPKNFGYPVNTGADDYYYVHVVKPDGSINAYLSSNRKDGKIAENTCCDNIYQFEYKMEEDPVLLILKCAVYDRDNDEMLNNVSFKLMNLVTDELVEKKNSMNENVADFSIYKDSSYYVLAFKEDYDTVMLSVNISEDGDSVYTEEVFLTKVKEEVVVAYVEPEIIELEPSSDYEFPIIYYGFNESGFSSIESKKLDELAKYLNNEATNITISVASHTDNIDTKNANIKLSKKRTEAVIAYLKRKGVNPDRLLGQWYGEDSPLVDNQTESGKDNPDARAKNRRTEFEIITDIASFQNGQMVAFAKELQLSQKAQNASGIMDDATLRKVLEKYGDMSKPDMIFRVQVGAYRNADANLKAKMKVYAKLQEQVEAFLQREEEGGYTKFVIGRVSTLNEANDIKEKAKKIGIRSSFIAPYYKGKRIRVVDAIEVLAE